MGNEKKSVMIDTCRVSLLIAASHSLCLTTVTPGVGLRKTPNSVSLIHVIMQLVAKEIDTITRTSDCQKLNFAFQILRNAIHSHECRVVISKVAISE